MRVVWFRIAVILPTGKGPAEYITNSRPDRFFGRWDGVHLERSVGRGIVRTVVNFERAR